MKRAAHKFLLALANGFILFFFSERLFWSVWRPGDSIPDLVVTWLAYSTLAYLFLATVWFFRVNNVWSLYLAGAVYGWLTEGGLIHTLYGTEESAPFPISISITGLSWHALLSVLVGWYATARALTARRPTWTAIIAIGVGVFWGCWATFLWRESPPILTPVPQFLGYALGTTILLAGAWWLNFRAGVTRFRPGWVGTILSLMILGTFYVQHVRRLGWLPLVVMPAVMALALVPLWRHHRRQSCGSALTGDQPAWLNLVYLGLMPIAATAVYAAAKSLRLDQVPVATIVYYWMTGPIGFVLLVIAIIQCAWPRREERRRFTNAQPIQPA
ncbi:MAG: hypothetical protein AB7O66_01965 [Limisphaerales bacterium]